MLDPRDLCEEAHFLLAELALAEELYREQQRDEVGDVFLLSTLNGLAQNRLYVVLCGEAPA